MFSFFLVKTPALESKDDKVVARSQNFVAERGADVCAAVVQVAVEADAKVAVAGADGQRVRQAADEERVLAGPLEDAEVVAAGFRLGRRRRQRVLWLCTFYLLFFFLMGGRGND